mmetsp:Transcript_7454/g.9203  ORF Transcript_7454/g.9203 Transcript_7454/m.9203 type:complete len:93 (+) Transcript_7454:529-807(+)
MIYKHISTILLNDNKLTGSPQIHVISNGILDLHNNRLTGELPDTILYENSGFCLNISENYFLEPIDLKGCNPAWKMHNAFQSFNFTAKSARN